MTAAKLRRLVTLVTTLVAAAVIVSACAEDPLKKGPSASPSPPPSTVKEAGQGMSADEIDELPNDLHDIANDASDAGCVVTAPDADDPDHIDPDDFNQDDYSSDPPSSGKHFDNWAKWGFYDEQLHDGYAVHNLEHGGVVVWYGDDVPDDYLNKLEDDVIEKLEKWVVAPRDDLDGVTSAAWGVLLTCDSTAIAAMSKDNFTDLLDEWYDDVNSRGTDQEGSLSAIPPAGDTSGFDPELPDPETDISDEAVF